MEADALMPYIHLRREPTAECSSVSDPARSGTATSRARHEPVHSPGCKGTIEQADPEISRQSPTIGEAIEEQVIGDWRRLS